MKRSGLKHCPTQYGKKTIPVHASQLYSRNVTAFLNLLIKDGELHLDMDDNIVGPSCVTHEGKWVNERVAKALGAPAAS